MNDEEVTNNNPSLLDLLEAGCTVEFPSGYCLVGVTETRYIECFTPDEQDGCHDLREEGLRSALWDELNFRRQQEAIELENEETR